jgi:hypothetical protein
MNDYRIGDYFSEYWHNINSPAWTRWGYKGKIMFKVYIINKVVCQFKLDWQNHIKNI